MTTRHTKIVRSSGNVFTDLGLPNAEELSTKAALAVRINELTSDLTQQKAAARLGLQQPKVSKLQYYEFDDFSIGKLMVLLTKLDCDVEITVRRRPVAQKRDARVFVVAA